MKNWILIMAMLTGSVSALHAQEGEETEKTGFRKENLFTGGGLSLSFGSRSFLVGASPVLGYRIADWVDAGIVVNFQYSTVRDYFYIDDRLRQTLYGGGLFTRFYPVNFLFVQAQGEHNFIASSYNPGPNGGSYDKLTTSATSLLVGGGYTQGRMPGVNSGSFYISVLFDVSGNVTPYTNNLGRPLPIIRAGVNIPLFGGGRGNY
jgi:hypothetical protein